jgi:hypothetical protein
MKQLMLINRQSQEELTLRDAAVAHLEQELSCVRSAMNELHQSSAKAMDDQALKCMVIIQESLSLEWILADRTVSGHHIPAQIADNKKKGMLLTMQLLK